VGRVAGDKRKEGNLFPLQKNPEEEEQERIRRKKDAAYPPFPLAAAGREGKARM